jgi:hypothetical protein
VRRIGVRMSATLRTPVLPDFSATCVRTGWPQGVTAPGAPTDPYVRALAHTVPLIMDSLRDRRASRTLSSAIRFCFVDTIIEFLCIRRVSQKRFHESASRFPPLAPAGCCSPTSSVLSRRYDALPPSRRASFPSLGGTSVALAQFAPWRTSAPPGPGVGVPVPPAGNSPRSEQGPPKFLGNHDCPFAHVLIRRRQVCSHQTIGVQQRGP